MNVAKHNEEVCKIFGIPVDETKKLPSDDEMEKLFDTFYEKHIFDDVGEVISMRDAFVKGYLTHLYQKG